LFAKNSSLFVDDAGAADGATYANRVTLSDEEDEDDNEEAESKAPPAPATALPAVAIGDASLYLEGDDDLDDLDDLSD